MKSSLPAFALLALTAPSLFAGLTITEIMFNPAGRAETNHEWVEIFNPNAEALELSGWIFEDLSTGSYALPAGSILEGHAAAVLLNHDDVSAFRTSWGLDEDVAVFYAGEFRLLNSSDDLRLSFGDPLEEVDTVSYGGSGWPSSVDGVSIYLHGGALDPEANDLGANWSHSAPGLDGAWQSLGSSPYLAGEFGSPGYVPGLDLPPVEVAIPEPAMIWPIGCTLLLTLLLTRRRNG